MLCVRDAVRLAAVARHRPGRLLCSSRTYIAGARNDFEHEFEVKNSAKRRTELQAFLAVLRPDETAALATQGELERVMQAQFANHALCAFFLQPTQRRLI